MTSLAHGPLHFAKSAGDGMAFRRLDIVRCGIWLAMRALQFQDKGALMFPMWKLSKSSFTCQNPHPEYQQPGSRILPA